MIVVTGLCVLHIYVSRPCFSTEVWSTLIPLLHQTHNTQSFLWFWRDCALSEVPASFLTAEQEAGCVLMETDAQKWPESGWKSTQSHYCTILHSTGSHFCKADAIVWSAWYLELFLFCNCGFVQYFLGMTDTFTVSLSFRTIMLCLEKKLCFGFMFYI